MALFFPRSKNSVREACDSKEFIKMTDFLSRRYQASDLVVDTQVGTEIVLLHLESGIYFGLNPVSGRIWEMMKQDITPAAICEAIAEEYDEYLETVQQDVSLLMADMIENELLIPVD